MMFIDFGSFKFKLPVPSNPERTFACRDKATPISNEIPYFAANNMNRYARIIVYRTSYLIPRVFEMKYERQSFIYAILVNAQDTRLCS